MGEMRTFLHWFTGTYSKPRKNIDKSRELCFQSNSLEDYFWAAAQKGGDNAQWSINELLPTIRLLVDDFGCQSAWEFGTAQCRSSCALLLGGIDNLTSVDIEKDPVVDHFSVLTNRAGKQWRQVIADSGEVSIDRCDLLLIDSFHNGEHLSRELRSASKVQKIIILHDTVTFWQKGDKGSGLGEAITTFLKENTHWVIARKFVVNNGLMVLKRNP